MSESRRVSENTASGSYKVAADDDTAKLERRRLQILGQLLDPISRRHIENTGIAAGWRCLEVGGGAGTVAAWMAQQVGATGEVLSTDVDLRFHCEPRGVLDVRQHDITSDPLPDAHFDLVHTRAVLQHIPSRELALDHMIAALKPGGWLVVEDGDFSLMEGAHIPEAFRTLSDAMTQLSLSVRDWDRHFGSKLLGHLQQRGLEQVDAEGTAWTMHGGTDSLEWYTLAMEHAGGFAVDAGLVTREQFEAALSEARQPGFAILSPLHVAAVGRKPGQP